MATIPRSAVGRKVDYPTSDGKPMAETDIHRNLMMDLIQTLEHRYSGDPNVYVSGNLLLFYEEGNRRKHISPDVFVVGGIEKRLRDNYLVWDEGKGPDLAIEITSKSTRAEDVKKKMTLYRDILRIPEYFLFDPLEEYLKPPMQGYRLIEGRYVPIEPVERRLPSEVLGLHFERSWFRLRLYDPSTGQLLPTPGEWVAESLRRQERAEAAATMERLLAERERAVRLETERDLLIERLRAERAEIEIEKLRREIEALRRGQNGS